MRSEMKAGELIADLALPQFNDLLLPQIRKIGCFFRSACFLAEYKIGRLLTADEINRVWNEAEGSAFIQKNNLVNASAVANLALRQLGGAGRFVEVATFEAGEMKWYGWVRKSGDISEIRSGGLFFIQKIKAEGSPSGVHFRVVDSWGNLVFDPFPGTISDGVLYSVVFAFFDK